MEFKMTELEQCRAYLQVLLYGIKEHYGIYSARRVIVEKGGVRKLQEIPDDKVEAVIAECHVVINSLGLSIGPRRIALKLKQ
jgi:hypothetical protein